MALRFLIATKSLFSPPSFIRQNRSLLVRNFSEEESAPYAELEEEIIFPANVRNNLNEVQLIGRLCGEPKEKEVYNYKSFVIAPLVTEHFYKNPTGSITKSVVYHQILFRNQDLANFALNHLTKGSKVHISGSIINLRLPSEDETSMNMLTCVRADKLVPLSRLIRKKNSERLD